MRNRRHSDVRWHQSTTWGECTPRRHPLSNPAARLSSKKMEKSVAAIDGAGVVCPASVPALQGSSRHCQLSARHSHHARRTRCLAFARHGWQTLAGNTNSRPASSALKAPPGNVMIQLVFDVSKSHRTSGWARPRSVAGAAKGAHDEMWCLDFVIWTGGPSHEINILRVHSGGPLARGMCF